MQARLSPKPKLRNIKDLVIEKNQWLNEPEEPEQNPINKVPQLTKQHTHNLPKTKSLTDIIKEKEGKLTLENNFIYERNDKHVNPIKSHTQNLHKINNVNKVDIEDSEKSIITPGDIILSEKKISKQKVKLVSTGTSMDTNLSDRHSGLSPKSPRMANSSSNGRIDKTLSKYSEGVKKIIEEEKLNEKKKYGKGNAMKMNKNLFIESLGESYGIMNEQKIKATNISNGNGNGNIDIKKQKAVSYLKHNDVLYY